MRIHIGARGIAAAMAASVVLAAACGGSSSGGSGNGNASGRGTGPVQTAQNSSLGTSVLVNLSGPTLYSLSA